MKISIFRLAQWLGWACCLAMTWMAQALYHKGDPMDGIFCLLLGILFSLILIHLLLRRSYEEKNKTRYAAITFASAKEKAATPISSKKEKQ
ncbi:hypothetical protein HMPREF0179_05064 [Bilophila wadsworthia 3_1_6]|uniref:Uncharacterized protein n=1 Tax=Bilophila wadsworthia (strain 3_1_6) TaxID=563192 RepID=S2LKL2_BILW3|nr:hypothetical protein [Bilophila wadsworthia]EPC05779.1 hypothetical protein HMPREF0179_05064 [Bilophila wadsworthia 3_1_6]